MSTHVVSYPACPILLSSQSLEKLSVKNILTILILVKTVVVAVLCAVFEVIMCSSHTGGCVLAELRLAELFLHLD